VSNRLAANEIKKKSRSERANNRTLDVICTGLHVYFSQDKFYTNNY
jgi:hypothetical protein